jgi:hypothetical protein
MNREEERSPPSPRCESWEDVTVNDIEEDRRGTPCPVLYHGERPAVRSAAPLSDWLVSVYQACPECCLPILGFSHVRCGE